MATVAIIAAVALSSCGSGTAHRADVTVPTRPSASSLPQLNTTTATVPDNSCVSVATLDAEPVAQRAAQLIVLPSLDFNVTALTPLLRNGAGGLLFLGNAIPPLNLRSEIATAIHSRRSLAVPLVMADVEGGGVQRLPGAVQSFPWPRELASTMTTQQVRALAHTVGSAMMRAGVNVDLAPVVDLDNGIGPSVTNPDGLRSFSPSSTITTRYANAFMQGLRSAGVTPVLKHFPGIGGSTRNTDYGTAATRPLSQLRAADLQPFISGIAKGAPAIMVSNANTPGLSTIPASVSPNVIQHLLRDQLGFSGLVLTDSLSAGAISAAGYTVPHAALAAIKAGADLVLFGSTLTAADVAQLSPENVAATRQSIIDTIVQAALDGDLPITRLDDAVRHVVAAKGLHLCP
jgi:beta-N-acetylhexosaminidase